MYFLRYDLCRMEVEKSCLVNQYNRCGLNQFCNRLDFRFLILCLATCDLCNLLLLILIQVSSKYKTYFIC